MKKITQLSRADAIQIIVSHEINYLTTSAKAAVLQRWWHIDSSDGIFFMLPASAQTKLATLDTPDNPDAAEFRPLLIHALADTYRGVKTDYLRQQLDKTGGNYQIEGTADLLYPCPCCDYRTLPDQGDDDICPVCFWKDDRTNHDDRYSPANEMTLADGKKNVRQLGAVSSKYIDQIDLDAPQKWSRNRSR